MAFVTLLRILPPELEDLEELEELEDLLELDVLLEEELDVLLVEELLVLGWLLQYAELSRLALLELLELDALGAALVTASTLVELPHDPPLPPWVVPLELV